MGSFLERRQRAEDLPPDWLTQEQSAARLAAQHAAPQGAVVERADEPLVEEEAGGLVLVAAARPSSRRGEVEARERLTCPRQSFRLRLPQAMEFARPGGTWGNEPRARLFRRGR